MAVTKAKPYPRLILNPKAFMRKFFHGLPQYSDEYIADIFSVVTLFPKDGALYNLEKTSAYLNCKDGLRFTKHQPEEFENRVYMFGPSWLHGYGCEDSHTIASFLQEAFNKNDKLKSYRVENYGANGLKPWCYLLQINNIDLKRNDIVILGIDKSDAISPSVNAIDSILSINKICLDHGAELHVLLAPHPRYIINPSDHEKAINIYDSIHCILDDEVKQEDLDNYTPAENYTPPDLLLFLTRKNISCYDSQHLFNRPHDMEEIFIDRKHWVYRGNKLIADYIYDIFSKTLDFPEFTEETKDKAESIATKKMIDGFIEKSLRKTKVSLWLKKVKASYSFPDGSRVGAIVMNCNPFTNGHLHLITESLKKVDYLYIFVVQENSSFFRFKDRINLVIANTKHLSERIHVVPSGGFIISAFTFPDYFTKEKIETEVKANTTPDIIIFGGIIAPGLNITDRFVGEEPTCQVTSKYNGEMAKFLPRMGVNLHILPRMSVAGDVISASKVRDCLMRKDFATLKKYVSPITYKYLIKRSNAGDFDA